LENYKNYVNFNLKKSIYVDIDKIIEKILSFGHDVYANTYELHIMKL